MLRGDHGQDQKTFLTKEAKDAAGTDSAAVVLSQPFNSQPVLAPGHLEVYRPARSVL